MFTLKKSALKVALLPLVASTAFLLASCGEEKAKEVTLQYSTPKTFGAALEKLLKTPQDEALKDLDLKDKSRVSQILQGAYLLTAATYNEDNLNYQELIGKVYNLSTKGDKFLFGRNFSNFDIDFKALYGANNDSNAKDNKFYYYTLVNPQLKSFTTYEEADKAYQEDLGELYPLASTACKVSYIAGKRGALNLLECLVKSVETVLILPPAQEIVHGLLAKISLIPYVESPLIF